MLDLALRVALRGLEMTYRGNAARRDDPKQNMPAAPVYNTSAPSIHDAILLRGQLRRMPLYLMAEMNKGLVCFLVAAQLLCAMSVHEKQ